jgi:hypothetical protein
LEGSSENPADERDLGDFAVRRRCVFDKKRKPRKKEKEAKRNKELKEKN